MHYTVLNSTEGHQTTGPMPSLTSQIRIKSFATAEDRISMNSA